MRANIWVAAAATVWVCTAAAQGDPLATRGGWEVGLQLSTYEYEEPDFALLEGERIGVSGAYTLLGKERIHARFEARFSYGEMDYTGSGTSENEPDYLFDTRALALWEFGQGAVRWVPYGGLGFRYLLADGRGVTSTGKYGYRRESHYFYIPLGVTLRVPIGGGWVMAPQLEYDGFVTGRQSTKYSDVSPLLPDISNRQTKGWGARGQLAFEGPRWSFLVWTNYWDIEDSDIQPIGGGFGLYEPANTTRESGVEARYRF